MMSWGIICSPPDRHNDNGDIACIYKYMYSQATIWSIFFCQRISSYCHFMPFMMALTLQYLYFYVHIKLNRYVCQINSGIQRWSLILFRWKKVKFAFTNIKSYTMIQWNLRSRDSSACSGPQRKCPHTGRTFTFTTLSNTPELYLPRPGSLK